MGDYKLCILIKPDGPLRLLIAIDTAIFPWYRRKGYEVIPLGDCDPRLSGLPFLATLELADADLDKIRGLLEAEATA